MSISIRTMLCGSAAIAALAVPVIARAAAQPQIVAAVDDNVTVSLSGDVSARARQAFDMGELATGTALPHIRLELKRPAAQQAALDALVQAQTTRGSASYHRWIAPAQLRDFGPASADIQKIAAWLTRQGLTVNGVSADGMMIDFGGTASSVGRAFHTTLHGMKWNEESHVANLTPPAIPAALAPAITGVTLHDFFPRPNADRVTPGYTSTGKSGTFYGVAPPDFATIYNLRPLYALGLTGAGTTIAVVEQTRIHNGDWNNFRKQFGLGGTKGTISEIHPGGCADPGFTGDEGEAAIDAEWSSAAAPDAAILEASCATAAPLNFGVEQALENLVTQPTPATIFSISYGGAEIFNGFAFTQAWTNLVEEGAAEGKAIFVSAGDSGASADRFPTQPDMDGLGVNALSDSQYVVSVGGTDFLDTFLGQDAKYWSPANSATGQSALSYIPETPWNNSCASTLVWKFNKFASPFAACNAAKPPPEQNDVGGTGGQSLFASKPSWQLTTIPGVPNDNSRDQPDVSLFAANGIWGHFYLICMSDAAEGGAPCNYKVQKDLLGNAFGGTSVSAPALAGITALIQQGITGANPLGNPNPYFYQIAQAQFSNPNGLQTCDSTRGKNIGRACAFNVITVGDNAQPCVAGTPNCFAPSGDAVGVLRAPKVTKKPAFPGYQGYSLATGLGTVNATNLFYNLANIYP